MNLIHGILSRLDYIVLDSRFHPVDWPKLEAVKYENVLSNNFLRRKKMIKISPFSFVFIIAIIAYRAKRIHVESISVEFQSTFLSIRRTLIKPSRRIEIPWNLSDMPSSDTSSARVLIAQRIDAYWKLHAAASAHTSGSAWHDARGSQCSIFGQEFVNIACMRERRAPSTWPRINTTTSFAWLAAGEPVCSY